MTTSSAVSQRAALIERFGAPGQPFEMGERTVRGVPMRVYTTGPLTLRDIALASTGAADRPFLSCRDERWSYAEQARIIAGLGLAAGGVVGGTSRHERNAGVVEFLTVVGVVDGLRLGGWRSACATTRSGRWSSGPRR
jgi:hypothetical protein